MAVVVACIAVCDEIEIPGDRSFWISIFPLFAAGSSAPKNADLFAPRPDFETDFSQGL